MDCIADLPGVMEVVMVHIVGTNKPASLRSDMVSSARTRIESEATLLNNLGIPSVRTEVMVHESPAAGIDDAANRNNSDIIVMGARGKSIIKGLRLGSVTQKVLHESKKNLLIMRGPIIETLSGEKFQKYCPLIFSRVLVPVDLTTESWTAVEQLAKIPDVQEIIAAFVISRGESEQEIERLRQQAGDELEKNAVSYPQEEQRSGGESLREILSAGLTITPRKQMSPLSAQFPQRKASLPRCCMGAFHANLRVRPQNRCL